VSARRCPRCGRTLPAGHALCIKCGGRLEPSPEDMRERVRTGRQVGVVVALVMIPLVAALIALAVWSATTPEEPDASPSPSAQAGQAGEEPDRPVALPGRLAPSGGPPARPRGGAGSSGARPTPPAPARRPGVPRQRSGSTGSGQGPSAGRPSPGFPSFGGPPRPPSTRGAPGASGAPGSSEGGTGLVQRVRHCVDRRREVADRECGEYRATLGHTVESLCLVTRTARAYWRCFEREGKGLGRCVGRCAKVARTCAFSCASAEGRRHPGGTAGCLWRCWRDDIDPCLGKCLRP